MPFAVVRCTVSWVAGGAVFTSVLMIAVLLTRLQQDAGAILSVTDIHQTIVTRSAGFLTSTVSGSSRMCEILILFSTCSMLSFTLRRGSRIVQRSVWSHSPRTVTHDVMNSGPSIAWITSNAEIVFGSRASV